MKCVSVVQGNVTLNSDARGSTAAGSIVPLGLDPAPPQPLLGPLFLFQPRGSWSCFSAVLVLSGPWAFARAVLPASTQLG